MPDLDFFTKLYDRFGHAGVPRTARRRREGTLCNAPIGGDDPADKSAPANAASF
jgi:hypothetical protein